METFKNQHKTSPTFIIESVLSTNRDRVADFTHSILKAALLPIKMSQLTGHFPLNIQKSKMVKNNKNKNPSLNFSFSLTSSKVLSIPIASLVGLLGMNVFLLVTTPLSTLRNTDWASEFKSMGTDTYSKVNFLWGVCVLLCPLIIRVDMLRKRKNISEEFWQRFLDMLNCFGQTCGQYQKDLHLFPNTIKYFVIPFTFLVTISSVISTYIYAFYSFSLVENEDLATILGILQDLMLMALSIFQSFAMFMFLYFITVYNYCAGLLINRLDNIFYLKQMKVNDFTGVRKLVEQYEILDGHVSQFNDLFGLQFVVNSCYTFIFVWYNMYICYTMMEINSLVLLVLSGSMLVLISLLFFLVALQSSQLTEKSEKFKNRLGYLFLNYNIGKLERNCLFNESVIKHNINVTLFKF